MILRRMRPHPSEVVAEVLDLLSSHFVEAVPGLLERANIQAEDLREPEVAGTAAEFAFVVAVAFAGVDGEETTVVEERESPEVEGAEREPEIAGSGVALGHAQPFILGKVAREQAFLVEVDGGHGNGDGDGDFLLRAKSPKEEQREGHYRDADDIEDGTHSGRLARTAAIASRDGVPKKAVDPIEEIRPKIANDFPTLPEHFEGAVDS